MTINERIKYLRKIKKISQKDLAKKLGLTQSGISYIEGHNNVVADKTIKTICSIFSINENWLRNGVEPIFNENNIFDLNDFARSKGASELEIEILKAYFDIDESLRKEVIKHFILYFKNDNKKTLTNKARDFVNELETNEPQNNDKAD